MNTLFDRQIQFHQTALATAMGALLMASGLGSAHAQQTSEGGVEFNGMLIDTTKCIGCRACEIACKDKNGLAPGPRFRRVMYIEGGSYPDVFAYKVNMSCNHCAEPACLPATSTLPTSSSIRALASAACAMA